MKRIVIIFVILASIAVIVLAGIIVQRQLLQPRREVATASIFTVARGMLHAQRSQLVDGSGHPFFLRGAQIQSSFVFIKGWETGKRPTAILNSKTFNVMAHDWKMNALRLPISNWIYAKDPANYMSELDQVVQQANAAGLYVVLDLHDNVKSGSPYGKDGDLPKAEDVTFWKTIAGHFKNNAMVAFDVYNEPKDHDWQTWLHGGGTAGGAKVVGFQDLVDAIRSVGAGQVIIVEPASTREGDAQAGGWSTIGSNTIKDPNIVYSLHVYHDITLSDEQHDAQWGPILNHYPIYYGEWAFLPNSPIPIQCRGVAHDKADQTVTNFLKYMASRHANWTAWSFTPPYLIQDTTTYAPTSLDVPWTCGNPSTNAGMGTLVKRYLARS